MDHAALVRVGQAFENLDHDVELALEGERLVGSDHRREVAPFHQLHGDVQLSVGFAEIVERDEIGMLEHAGRAGLTHEALPRVVGFADASGEELERYVAADDGVVCFPYDTHGSLADEVVELEFAHAPIAFSLGHAGRRARRPMCAYCTTSAILYFT